MHNITEQRFINRSIVKERRGILKFLFNQVIGHLGIEKLCRLRKILIREIGGYAHIGKANHDQNDHECEGQLPVKFVGYSVIFHDGKLKFLIEFVPNTPGS